MNRVKVAGLSLSAAALVAMAVHEGYRDRAYYATADERDRGISTIGFGNTEGVKPTDTITVEKALVRLLATADKMQQQMRQCLGDQTEMTQPAWDALTSLTYNIGVGNFCSSTLVKKAKAGQEFCSEILRWNRQSGVILAGLTKRRQEEYQKCLGN